MLLLLLLLMGISKKNIMTTTTRIDVPIVAILWIAAAIVIVILPGLIVLVIISISRIIPIMVEAAVMIGIVIAIAIAVIHVQRIIITMQDLGDETTTMGIAKAVTRTRTVVVPITTMIITTMMLIGNAGRYGDVVWPACCQGGAACIFCFVMNGEVGFCRFVESAFVPLF